MARDIVNVMILGASGLLGHQILKALTQDPNLNLDISVLTRQSSHATFPSTTTKITIKQIQDTYPLAQLIDSFHGQDFVISALPGGDIDLAKRIIDAAVTAGVSRFIPSEFGNNTCEAASVQVPLYARKAEIAQYLRGVTTRRNVEIERDGGGGRGFSWTAIHCGQFFDWGLESGWLDFDLVKKQVTIYDSGDRKWSSTNIGTVGVAVARVVRRGIDDEAVRDKELLISSFTVSQNEVLRLLREVTSERGDEEEWKVRRLNSQEALAKAAGYSDESAKLKVRVITLMYADGEDDKGGNFEGDERLANELLGLEREDMKEVVRSLLK